MEMDQQMAGERSPDDRIPRLRDYPHLQLPAPDAIAPEADRHPDAASRPGTVADRVRVLLDAGDVDGALRHLNARTRFRFTGIFRADPPLLRTMWLVDRENPDLNVSGAVTKLDDTYCAITCATNAPFRTRDARRDARLRAHSARESTISYAGVPIRLANGVAWGTLCHYDARPRLIAPAELPILEAASPLFAAWIGESGEWGMGNRE